MDSKKIENFRGDIKWINEDGELHRLNGPAYISGDGNDKEWWVNGFPHRLDGPALEWDSSDNKQYYIDGERVEEDRFLELSRKRKLKDIV